MTPETYRIQDACANCRHQLHSQDGVYYCTLNSPIDLAKWWDHSMLVHANGICDMHEKVEGKPGFMWLEVKK